MRIPYIHYVIICINVFLCICVSARVRYSLNRIYISTGDEVMVFCVYMVEAQELQESVH